MKLLKTNNMMKYALAGTIAVMIGACNSRGAEVAIPQAEPQIIVVTATPQAVVVETPAQPSETTVGSGAVPVLEVAEAPPTEVEVPQAETPSYEAGTLLKGSGDGVFYVTDDNTRLHIYDWETFLAFGFSPSEIVEVADEELADIPLAGELARLLESDGGQLYWVMAGQRLWLDKFYLWQNGADQREDFGVPVTDLESVGGDHLPMFKGFTDDTLLQTDTQTYYYHQREVMPVGDRIAVPAAAIEIPLGVVRSFRQVSRLSATFSILNSETQRANVRSGPGLEFEVLTMIERGRKFKVTGQSEDGGWLQVTFQNQAGWVARDLVEDTVGVNLLATVEYVGAPAAELPQAEPAALTQETTVEVAEPVLQPLICTDVPIRGFGAVWGDQVAVQHGLGCPTGWPTGEQATNAAVQTFEHGLMLWLEADSTYNSDPVYVFFNDGTFQRFGDLGLADADKIGSIPAGFSEVGNKFSKVYWEGTGARVKERLGYATSKAQDSAGAFQQFNRGRMFWAEAADEIYVIYDYSYYDEENEQSIRVRMWQSFEDRF